jgi:hypothetical protein
LLERYRRGETLTGTEWSNLSIYLGRYYSQEGKQATEDLVNKGSTPGYGYPYAGSRDMQRAYVDDLAKAREAHWLLSLLMGRERTPNEEAYLEARTQAGLYWNTAPNESFYPSAMALRPFLNEFDAITNSSLAALGYLGATAADADPTTRYNLTMTLSNLSDIGGSFILPRTGLGAAFGETVVAAKTAKGGGTTLEIEAGKFDYLFGRVSSNTHNAARSNQLALEMKRLGILDTPAGYQMLSEHLTTVVRTEGNIVNTFSNQYGNFVVRESFFMGPSGKAVSFESTFQVLENGTQRFITTIPHH